MKCERRKKNASERKTNSVSNLPELVLTKISPSGGWNNVNFLIEKNNDISSTKRIFTVFKLKKNNCWRGFEEADPAPERVWIMLVCSGSCQYEGGREWMECHSCRSRSTHHNHDRNCNCISNHLNFISPLQKPLEWHVIIKPQRRSSEPLILSFIWLYLLSIFRGEIFISRFDGK